MNNCDKYLELISNYLDSKIMDAELAEHLESCPSCSEELKAMQEVVHGLNALPVLQLPEGFHERSMEKVRKEARTAKVTKLIPRSINFTGYVSVAAAVVICFVLLGSMLSFANSAIAGRRLYSTHMYAGVEALPLAAPLAGEIATPISQDITPSLREQGRADTWAQPSTVERQSIEPISPPADYNIARGNFNIVHSNHEEIISKHYTINLTVEDMDLAVLILRASGHEIEPSSISAYGSFMGLTVPEYEFENLQSLVMSLGEIDFEWGGRTDLTRETNDLAVRYLARLEESRRLASLIDRAERAEDILILQNRISQVEHDRARFRGTYNRNLVQSQSVSIAINLTPVGTPIYHAPQSFPERVSNAFTDSVNFTTTVFEGVLVLAASFIVPLGLLAAVCGIGYFSYRKIKKPIKIAQKGGTAHEESK